jgi:hypothetical protein
VPDARRPASPGQPRRERRDAVTQQEEFDDMASAREAPEPTDAAADAGADAAADARHAERRAHTPRDRDAARRR